MNEAYDYRRLLPEQFEQAYEMLCVAHQWAQKKGFEHKLIPRQKYYDRHVLGLNRGLFRDDTLCYVHSVLWDAPNDNWIAYLPDSRFVWLASAAVHHDFRGLNLARVALKSGEAYAAKKGIDTLFFGCFYNPESQSWLQYYHSCGYDILAHRTVVSQDGTERNIALMQKILNLTEQ